MAGKALRFSSLFLVGKSFPQLYIIQSYHTTVAIWKGHKAMHTPTFAMLSCCQQSEGRRPQLTANPGHNILLRYSFHQLTFISHNSGTCTIHSTMAHNMTAQTSHTIVRNAAQQWLSRAVEEVVFHALCRNTHLAFAQLICVSVTSLVNCPSYLACVRCLSRLVPYAKMLGIMIGRVE